MKTIHHLYLFTLLFSAILYSATASAAPNARGKPRPNPAPDRTQLRPDQPTFMVVTNSRGAELRHLNVEVHNIGNHQALEITVFAEVNGKLVFPLRGPTRLLSHQSGLYFLRSRTPLGHEGPVAIIARCANCRR